MTNTQNTKQKHTWKQAFLGIVPPMSKEEWDSLDLLSRYLIATRASVTIMTFLSGLIAGILAATDNKFHWLPFIAVIIGLMSAHLTNDLLNDWSDARRGVDQGSYFRNKYSVEPLENGFMTSKQVLGWALASLTPGIIAGLYLIIQSTDWRVTLGISLAGLFFLLFYTWPLKYIGMGEVAVILTWGPLMIGGGYYVIAGSWSWNVVLAGLPYALGVTSVIFGKHIDKYDEDKKKGIHTLPVIIGEKAARYTMMAAVIAQYVITVYLVIIGFFNPVMLIVFLSIWDKQPYGVVNLLKRFSKKRPAEKPAGWAGWPLYFVRTAFAQNKNFGKWFVLGLILQAIIVRTGIMG